MNGSHQFHDGHLSLRWGDFDPPIEGSSNFDDWSREVGGVHPQTGEPLKFETISVEPGSICAVALYTLHGVAPVADDREFTRYGTPLSLESHRSSLEKCCTLCLCVDKLTVAVRAQAHSLRFVRRVRLQSLAGALRSSLRGRRRGSLARSARVSSRTDT